VAVAARSTGLAGPPPPDASLRERILTAHIQFLPGTTAVAAAPPADRDGGGTGAEINNHKRRRIHV
jgi:hypothetical protein